MKLFPDPDETIEGVGRALRSGQRTCVDVLESCLTRIDAWEPKIRAWVVVDREGAMEQARRLDEELAAGKCRGPLHGIPIGIKDMIDVAGLPTAAGFRPWADRRAKRDAEIVDRLRRAGAVILGKTVTTQFAWIDPPPTRNPWNLERTPGGSSSGSAAAVACGMCLGALGTQTGGSIIRPASYCGVAGFKPTYGAVRCDGIVPLAPSLDHPGPIARTARDLVLLGHEIVTRDSGDCEYPRPDPAYTPEEFKKKVPRILPSQRRLRIPKLRRLRGFHDRHVEPVMREAFDGVLAALVEAGAEVTDLDEEACDFEGILRGHRVIMAAEAAAEHESRFAEYRDDYLPQIRELIEEGLATPVTRYIRCHQEKLRFNLGQRLETRLDLESLVTPATTGPAPDASTTGSASFNSPWSYLGTPTVSIPIGLSPEGLPLAMQLVGDHDLGSIIGDYALLDTAVWCETVIRRAYSMKE